MHPEDRHVLFDMAIVVFHFKGPSQLKNHIPWCLLGPEYLALKGCWARLQVPFGYLTYSYGSRGPLLIDYLP